MIFSLIIGVLLPHLNHSFMVPSFYKPATQELKTDTSKKWKAITRTNVHHMHAIINHKRTTQHGMVPPIHSSPTISIPAYCFVANFIYICRRSSIRNMSKRKLLKIRLTREEDVSLKLYITNILTWQIFVTLVYPLLEPMSRLFGYVSFYYFYPNASGMGKFVCRLRCFLIYCVDRFILILHLKLIPGLIFEPLSAQNLPLSKRTKSQIRCDWHRFSVNIGAIGRDGYRHPPSIELHRPHLDVPAFGLKHWPWRRRYNTEERI